MNRNSFAGITVVLLAIATGAPGSFAGGANTVVQTDRSFHPGEINIAKGSTLDISNQDEFIHQVYVDSAGFKYDSEEQSPGETFHIVFPAAGTFAVRCHIHPKMLLTVHVK